MDLTDDLFEMYFDNKIHLEEFVEMLGFKEKNFLNCLQVEIEKTTINHDADRLENLLCALLLWEDRNGEDNIQGLVNFLKVLDDLLISDWHTQHENIVLLLQKISDVESLEYLFNAIELKPQYLSWDDNYAFEIKCVRAIYYIGKERAIQYLEKLCRNENDIIREMAQRQLSKL